MTGLEGPGKDKQSHEQGWGEHCCPQGKRKYDYIPRKWYNWINPLLQKYKMFNFSDFCFFLFCFQIRQGKNFIEYTQMNIKILLISHYDPIDKEERERKWLKRYPKDEPHTNGKDLHISIFRTSQILIAPIYRMLTISQSLCQAARDFLW